ncbi:DUF6401 family natural product biosynthesis protein [Bailinhaonella thermotolerans]|uniref:Uncharacterized protein n=1 Tax=Bailinhaonella thermotolerans TaxID=1070861 RepID=A0A3A4BLV6_9ACTN|nr:DUF6401 family natural product biosynthesis protein [Bailinhaonella thermotolerans]RJL32002.1 hypothetical protein D5H75_16325 [Bailinhaonella thermotolerans]
MSEELMKLGLSLALSIGEAGLSHVSTWPGLLAAVDQHAAEVRDALLGCGEVIGSDAISDYTRGFVQASIERGWWPPVEDAHEMDRGAGHDWETTRLIALTWLSRHSSPGVTAV